MLLFISITSIIKIQADVFGATPFDIIYFTIRYLDVPFQASVLKRVLNIHRTAK